MFTWIDKPKEFLSWADKSPGLIDFALTTLRPFTADENFKQTSKVLSRNDGDGGLGVKYLEPKEGGRKRKDGKDVKWVVTRPEFSDATETPSQEYFPTTRTDAPFFCHDLTPRFIRVPFDEDEITHHSCGATGIAAVEVLVPPEKLTAYSTLYASITGVAPKQITQGDKKGVEFALTTPTSQGGGPVVRVRVPTSDVDKSWLKERGVGIRAVQLSVKGKKKHGEKQLGDDAMASTFSLVW